MKRILLLASALLFSAIAFAQTVQNGVVMYTVNIDTIENVRDNMQQSIDAVNASVANLRTQVQNLQASIPPAVDLTPLQAAVASLQSSLASLASQQAAALAPPTISNASAVCTATNCAITWTTNTGATTQLAYGQLKGSPQNSTTLVNIYSTAHTATIPLCPVAGTCWAYPQSGDPYGNTRYTAGVNY